MVKRKRAAKTLLPKARLVLKDAIHVRHLLEDEPRMAEWRLYWILAVVLLRAVGHALDKIDGKSSAEVKAIASKRHKLWKSSAPEHLIFREFIEKTRNSIVKEYELGMSEGPIPIAAVLRRHDGVEVLQQALIEENIYRPIPDGEYEGEDGRTVVDDAIEWWKKELDLIDQEASRSGKF